MARTDRPQRDLVFCGGVHGVGKTSFCRALAEHLCATHLSAGSMLRNAGLAKLGQYEVLQSPENQASVQAMLQEYRRQNSGARIILDGHFCLLTANQGIQVLPVALFGSLEPIALLVVVDEPMAISTRLANRDGAIFDPNFIDRFQRREVARARAVSRQLCIPLQRVTPDLPPADVAEWILGIG